MTMMFQVIVWCRYGACIVTYLITLRYRHQRSTVSATSGYVTRTCVQYEMASVLSTANIFSTLSVRKPTTGSAVCDPPIGPLLRQPPLQGSPSKRPAGPQETDSIKRRVGLYTACRLLFAVTHNFRRQRNNNIVEKSFP